MNSLTKKIEKLEEENKALKKELYTPIREKDFSYYRGDYELIDDIEIDDDEKEIVFYLDKVRDSFKTTSYYFETTASDLYSSFGFSFIPPAPLLMLPAWP